MNPAAELPTCERARLLSLAFAVTDFGFRHLDSLPVGGAAKLADVSDLILSRAYAIRDAEPVTAAAAAAEGGAV